MAMMTVDFTLVDICIQSCTYKQGMLASLCSTQTYIPSTSRTERLLKEVAETDKNLKRSRQSPSPQGKQGEQLSARVLKRRRPEWK